MKAKEQILEALSLKEKAKLFVGKNSWELEEIEGKNIFVSDGPHGIRKEINHHGKKKTVKAICYPAASLSACSFDPDLIKKMGVELAKECIHHHIDVLLGPAINIKRNPLCGRNFEYFSEDPFLTGTLATAYIQGVQSKNIGTSLKHFALNSQEYARLINDSVVDDRAMREIYLKAFEMAIKQSKPWTVMASYNKVNGLHATENKELLTEIGRNEFGFDGIYVSDWSALYRSVESLAAGLDLEMPGWSKGSETLIAQAIENGELEEQVLDDSTKRMIDLYARCQQPKADDFNPYHALALAKQMNDESIVLLKNQDDILPLNKKQKVALIGDFCVNPRYQGGGSSQINPIYVSDLWTEFSREKIDFQFALGYDSNEIQPNLEKIAEAVKIAKDKDAVIIMCGLPRIIESEGYDREGLDLPKSQLELIKQVAKVNPNIIVVLQNGAPVKMPFIHQVKGIVEAYLGGSIHAKSIKDILYGKVNPSGRLAETFPLDYQDVVSANYYLDNPYTSLYKESIYVGYRYYDTFDKPVLFPFGYGLSYAQISYSDFQVQKQNNQYVATFLVVNHSDISAKEVVQLYVGQKNSSIFKPKKELKAFTKVELQPREVKEVSLTVSEEDLKYYSIANQKWQLEEGIYRFYLAKHVQDQSLYVDVKVDSEDEPEKLENKLSIYYSMDREVSNIEFEALLGRKIQPEPEVLEYTLETPMRVLWKTVIGYAILKPIYYHLLASTKDEVERKIYKKAFPNLPFRALQLGMSLRKQQMQGLVDLMNGKYRKGLKKFCKQYSK